MKNGVKDEVSKWVFCFTSRFQFSDKYAYSRNHCTACRMLNGNSLNLLLCSLVVFLECNFLLCRKLKKDIFFSPLLETHWTNGQQVHLHISPIGYNHTVCRLRESWNFNEWCFSFHTHELQSLWMEWMCAELTLFKQHLQTFFMVYFCLTGAGWMEFATKGD